VGHDGVFAVTTLDQHDADATEVVPVDEAVESGRQLPALAAQHRLGLLPAGDGLIAGARHALDRGLTLRPGRVDPTDPFRRGDDGHPGHRLTLARGSAAAREGP